MTAFSLLLFPCGVALVWLMVDSNEAFTKWQCYRTGLGREAGEGRFLGKINKFINNGWLWGAQHRQRI